MKMAAQQEKPMTSTPAHRARHGHRRPDAARKPAAAGPAFRIRYGRLALALAGVLSLLTGVVSAALRIFGLGSAWLPVVTLLGAVAAVVLLRRLAVRDRRRKVNAAFRAAMSAPAAAVGDTPPRRSAPGAGSPCGRPASVKRPESPLFDAQAGTADPKARTEAADRPGTAPGGPGRSRGLRRHLRPRP